MRKLILIAALAGAIGVIAGAFGAHALKATLAERNTVSTWNTAVLYQLIHAVALLSTATRPCSGSTPRRIIVLGAGAWIAGITLFSGSLYWLALGGPRWLGPITPLGGLLFIAGWVAVGISAFKNSPKD